MSEAAIVPFGSVAWEPRTEDEWPCLVKRQIVDPERGISIRTVWYARGVTEPRHVHEGTHAAIVLLGQAVIDDQGLGPWDVVYGPGRAPHGPLHYPFGCMLFAMLSGDALHMPVGDDVAPPADGLPAHQVLAHEREWEPAGTAAEWTGERKLLVADESRGYTAGLGRWQPGQAQRFAADAGHCALLVLSGRAEVEGAELRPWDLAYAPGGGDGFEASFSDECVAAVTVQASEAS